MTREVGKLGRLPSRLEVPKLSDYMTDPFPQVDPRSTFDGTSGIKTGLGMLGNDTYGDCVFAGYVHTYMLNAWLAGEQPAGNVPNPAVWPTQDQVLTAYFTYGGSPQPTNYVWSAQNGYDNGADMATAALWFTKNTIGPLPKLAAFASVADSGEIYEGAMQAFGTVWTGIMVSNEMLSEYQAEQPWSSLATDWVGGHCVPHSYRSPTLGKCVTWGQEQEFTWPNWRVVREEAFVLLTEEQLKAQKFFDAAKLQADIKALGGTT